MFPLYNIRRLVIVVKRVALVRIRVHITLVHTLTSYIWKRHFNIIPIQFWVSKVGYFLHVFRLKCSIHSSYPILTTSTINLNFLYMDILITFVFSWQQSQASYCFQSVLTLQTKNHEIIKTWRNQQVCVGTLYTLILL